MRLSILALLATTVLVGCSGGHDDLQQFVAEVQQATQVSIEPYPEFNAEPAFKYIAQKRRDPFTRPQTQSPSPVSRTQANCQQPDFERPKTALERYGADALTIRGFFTNQRGTWALIQANDNTLHKATVGDRMGLFFGRITAIGQDQITLQEMLPDGTGCWQQQSTTLTIDDGTGDNE